mgnify:CR=1 FL=1
MDNKIVVFTKPGCPYCKNAKEFLDNLYTDEITGRGSLTGQGTNQPKLTQVVNPNDSADKYIRQTINTGGKPGATDNGLLGITQINVRQGLDFLPVITVQLVDIKLPGESNEFGSTVIGNEGIRLFDDMLTANSRLIEAGYDVKLDLNASHAKYKPVKFLIYCDL